MLKKQSRSVPRLTDYIDFVKPSSANKSSAITTVTARSSHTKNPPHPGT